MTLLEARASRGVWSRSLHFGTVSLHSNTSKSLMLILEQLMIADMCTSAPGTLWRADNTSNVQLPFLCASSKSA